MLEVSRGAYLYKLDAFDLMRMERKDYMSSGRIITVGNDKYDIEDFCDRSDKAMLIIEYKDKKLKEIFKIEDRDYTHIVRDSTGEYFAVELVSGNKTVE